MSTSAAPNCPNWWHCWPLVRTRHLARAQLTHFLHRSAVSPAVLVAHIAPRGTTRIEHADDATELGRGVRAQSAETRSARAALYPRTRTATTAARPARHAVFNLRISAIVPLIGARVAVMLCNIYIYISP